MPDVDESRAGGPWFALQQLIVKALFQPDTEALHGRADGGSTGGWNEPVAHQPSSFPFPPHPTPPAPQAGSPPPALKIGAGSGAGITAGKAGVEAVLGDAEAGLAIAISAALPWIVSRSGELAGPIASFLVVHAGACRAVGWWELASVLDALSLGPPQGREPGEWLADVCAALCPALFPRYSRSCSSGCWRR